jgi:hypothetical protein
MSTVHETYTLDEISDVIPELAERFRREPKPEPIIVTDDHGKPVIVILPWKLYLLIKEALDVGMEPIRAAQQQKLSRQAPKTGNVA